MCLVDFALIWSHRCDFHLDLYELYHRKKHIERISGSCSQSGNKVTLKLINKCKKRTAFESQRGINYLRHVARNAYNAIKSKRLLRPNYEKSTRCSFKVLMGLLRDRGRYARNSSWMNPQHWPLPTTESRHLNNTAPRFAILWIW